MDGQAFGAFYSILCGVKDGTDLPAMKPLPWYMWLVIYCVLPFTVPVLAVRWVLLRVDHNALKKGKGISLRKKSAATMEIEINKVKAISKSMGCTVNDVLMAFVTNGMHAHYASLPNPGGDNVGYRDGKIPDSIRMGVPMSLRTPVRDLAKVDFSN